LDANELYILTTLVVKIMYFWSFFETVQNYVCDVSGTLWLFVTIYCVNNTTYVNQQLLKVKILATCFSYSEPS